MVEVVDGIIDGKVDTGPKLTGTTGNKSAPQAKAPSAGNSPMEGWGKSIKGADKK